MNAFTRALAALATITLLSVDDIEAPRKADMITIKRDDQNQSCSNHAPNPELSGMPAPEPGVLELEPYEVRTRIPGPLDELLRAVNRAAGELQYGGARENRIALQLLTATARFHAETGTP